MLNYNDVLDGLETRHIAAVGTDVYCVEPFPRLPFQTLRNIRNDVVDHVDVNDHNNNSHIEKSNFNRIHVKDQHLFLSHPHVICTPHIAGVTEISYRNMAQILAENVLRLLNGEKPLGTVNDINV